MTLEVLGPKNNPTHYEVQEESMSPLEEKMLRGGLLDMWQLYQHLSTTPDRLSDLTFFDTLSARDGMLFPDFFNAVHNFLHPGFFTISRIEKPHSEGADGLLEAGLDETFRTMASRGASYGPFFDRHPELRYLRELRFFANEAREFSLKFPFLRGVEPNRLWSIVEYYRLRGNLDLYVTLDAAISRGQEVGTLFEEDIASYPGDFRVYLLPYGETADRITRYLPLLKHGDLIGFGTVALADADGQQFVAVTSLQTDLLRKDRVSEVSQGITFSHYRAKKNEDESYTIPAGVRKPYLVKYDWAHRLVSAIENAAVEISDRFPVSGVIIPTLSTYGTGEFECLSRSQYASGLYELFPKERGYHQSELSPTFPLTEQWENGARSGSGKWWVKPINELSA